MPFRDKFKRALGRNNDQGDTSTTTTDPKAPLEKRPVPVWSPPPPKRQPLETAQKARLEAFSFANTFRRKSSQTEYSPRNSTVITHRSSAHEKEKRKSALVQEAHSANDSTSETGDSRVAADGEDTTDKSTDDALTGELPHAADEPSAPESGIEIQVSDASQESARVGNTPDEPALSH